MTASTLTEIESGRTAAIPRAKRSIADLLASLDRLAQTTPGLIAKPAGRFEIDGPAHELPRYVFLGAKSGEEPIRIGLFAAIHGDEAEGTYALAQLLGLLGQNPELAAGKRSRRRSRCL